VTRPWTIGLARLQTAEIDRLIVRMLCVGIKRPKATAREEMHFLTESR
jgi:hypothetical protein